MAYKPRKTDRGVVFMRVKPILYSYWPMYEKHVGSYVVKFKGKSLGTRDDVYNFILQEKIDLVSKYLSGERLEEKIKGIKRGFRKNYSRLLYTGIVWFSEALEKKLREMSEVDLWNILYAAVDEIAKQEGTIAFKAMIHDSKTEADLHEYVLDESVDKVQSLHFHFAIIGYQITRPYGDFILPVHTNPLKFRDWRNIFVEEIKKRGVSAHDSDALYLDAYGKIPTYMEEIREEEMKKKALDLYWSIKKEKEQREREQ